MTRKIYEPVREFERQTSYCPLYLVWRIVDEARDYFRSIEIGFWEMALAVWSLAAPF